MSRKYKFHNKSGLYFVSFATVYWLDVFTRQVYFNVLAESIDYCLASSLTIAMGNNPASNVDPSGGCTNKRGEDCVKSVLPGTSYDADGIAWNHDGTDWLGTAIQGETVFIGSNPSASGLLLSSSSLATAKTLDYVMDQSKGFSLKHDMFYNPLNSNRTLFSLPKTVTPKVKLGLKGLGYGLSLYSANNIESDYRTGNISEEDRYYSHSLNVIGTVVPLAGIGIAGGDYLGRKYHKEITHEITTEGTVTVTVMSRVLEIMGLPPSKQVQDNWNSNGKPSFFNRLLNNK